MKTKGEVGGEGEREEGRERGNEEEMKAWRKRGKTG